MIRINLLAVERKAVKAGPGPTGVKSGQKLTIACTAILLAGALFIGWRYWTVQQESAKLDKDIADAQTETSRLHAIILQVQQFEQQKAQLQQRVVLIEQLRKTQTGPVHILDQISRALPPMLWLTELKQGLDDSVVIDGKCTTLTGVSDFVANLEGSGYFRKGVDVVTSLETLSAPAGELIKFTLKAQFQQPGAAAAAPKQGG
jgi:type IV pilus assembly protein PilN